jgi:hypothetical protein
LQPKLRQTAPNCAKLRPRWGALALEYPPIPLGGPPLELAGGSPDLPPGRFASGITDTPLGPLRLIGVCVPWAGAHVSTGREDRNRWQDHTAYLAALGEIIRATRAAGPPPLVVLGDFNQMVPSPTAPPSAQAALRAALGPLDLCTARASSRLVDHIAVPPELAAAEVHAWDPPARGKRPVSDHLGATAKVTLATL